MLGNIYALLAAGLALIFGVAHLINFAHGSVYMVGSYLGWLLMTVLGWPLWAALPVAMAGSAAVGLILERFAVRPFRKSARVAPLLATIGAGMILDSLGELIFSPNPRPFPAVVPSDRFDVGGVSLGWLDLIILGATVASAVGLFVFLKLSKTGQALRATAQDSEAAQQMGVPVNRVNATAFALASALEDWPESSSACTTTRFFRRWDSRRVSRGSRLAFSADWEAFLAPWREAWSWESQRAWEWRFSVPRPGTSSRSLSCWPPC